MKGELLDKNAKGLISLRDLQSRLQVFKRELLKEKMIAKSAWEHQACSHIIQHNMGDLELRAEKMHELERVFRLSGGKGS